MAGIQCRCGRFLAKPHATCATNEWGDWHLDDVRGDCSRCGPDVQADREGDNIWWWSWDAWKWPAEIA